MTFDLDIITRHARDDIFRAELTRQNAVEKYNLIPLLKASKIQNLIIANHETQIQNAFRKTITMALSITNAERTKDLIQALNNITDFEKLNTASDRYLTDARKHVHTLEIRQSDYSKHLAVLESRRTTWFITCIILQTIGLTFALLSSHWN